MSRQSKRAPDVKPNALAHELLKRSGVENSKVMAAIVGRKTYGPQRLENWAKDKKNG